MKILKYLKTIGWIVLINLVFSFIITIFHYFDFFSPSTIQTLKLFSVILSMFIGGIYIGKKSEKKGYLEGIKIGLIIILIIFLITIISKNFELKTIIYYLLILVSSCFGAMIGIQRKRNS